jgi:hypothetical protein
LAETGRYSLLGQSLAVRKSVSQHAAIRDDALTLATEMEYDLVLIHWPLPHAPYFFDRRRGTPTAANRGPAGYVDNLVLTDVVLGELLDAIDSCSAERSSAVIVTSDHWWRASASFDGRTDRRVPFGVRLPASMRTTHGTRYDGEFETVRTAELILDLLAGRLCRPDDVVTWLAAGRRPARAASPSASFATV